MRSLSIGALVLALGGQAGCTQQKPVTLTEGARSYSAKDYDKILAGWTREVKLISMDEMDNVLAVKSTYQSWDFRWAYTERYAHDYRLSPSEKDAFLQRSLDESRKFHQFYVALYAQHPKWGDLKVDEPAWIVLLVDSTGQETEPAELHRIRKPSAMIQTYFPYTSPHRTVYRISFPTSSKKGKTVSDDAEWFGLRFAGAQGTTRIVWRLE